MMINKREQIISMLYLNVLDKDKNIMLMYYKVIVLSANVNVCQTPTRSAAVLF